jgi:hypothetical protein
LYDFACIFVHVVHVSDPIGGLKRSIGDSAGFKLIIRESVSFERAVALDNGFEFRRARAIASLNFEHSREAVKEFAGGSMISKANGQQAGLMAQGKGNGQHAYFSTSGLQDCSRPRQ